MRDETFHRVIQEIKPFLVAYLEEHEIEFNDRNFTNCVNREHDDADPSMHLVPGADNQILHCFGCGATYNIFHCARELDGHDNRGTGFLTETIPFLADKFGIDFNKADLELNEEALAKYRYQHLYNDAAEVLKEIGTYEHTTERGWNESVCNEHIVKSVDWDTFLTRLRNRGGYTEDEVKSKGIHRALFGSNIITFTIRNQYGKVCGFVARNILFDENIPATHPKYRNTSNDVPIYNKSKLLYGLEIAVKHPEKRLDIFEGYADWVTAQAHGHRHCVAMGGVALTRDHLDILHDIGFQHINLIFDDDTTGQTKMEGYLDRYCGLIEDMRVTVMRLPFKDNQPKQERDPDHYFQSHTLKEYMQVSIMTAFDWRLNKLIKGLEIKAKETPGVDDLDLKSLMDLFKDDLIGISKNMIPYIMSEPSPIEQGRMAKSLATQTGVREHDIREEIKVRGNRQVKDISETVQQRLRHARDSIDIKEILDTGVQRIESVTAHKDFSSFHHTEVLTHLEDFFLECDDSEAKPTGWITGWDCFDNPAMSGGIPKRDGIITLAGPPNHGKALVLTTQVLTSVGWKNHGNLRVKDEIFSQEGRLIKVLAVGPPTQMDCLVTFSDGEQIQCHEDHEWVVFDSSTATKGNPGERIIETKYLETVKLKKNDPSSNGGYRYRFRVDSQQRIETQKKDLLLHPYILGVWLGDGQSNILTISHAPTDQEHIKKIENITNITSRKKIHRITGVIYSIFKDLSSSLREINVYNNKHIPQPYLMSSVDQRLELLAGLIDSDGHVHKTNGRVVFSNCNKRLIDDTTQLIRSLGFRASVSSFEPQDGGSPNGEVIHGRQTVYQLSFTPNTPIPTVLPRKQILAARGKQRKRSIISIERVKPEPGNCIQVEGGIYLVGKHFVPTHNSAVLINLGKQLILPEQNNKNMSALFWYLDDSKNVAWSKFLASMTTFPILDVKQPWRRINKDPEKKKVYDGWRDYLRSCVVDKKLLIKSHEIGNDLEALQYWIKHVQDSTGNDVVVFVDALHDITTGETQYDRDLRMRYVRICEWIEKNVVNEDFTFVTCAHITKSGMAKGRPDQNDLSETGKILFASTLIGMVYSELDYLTSVHRRDESIMYWNDPDTLYGLDHRKPIVEVSVTKNKEGGLKDILYFKHKADACSMEPLTTEETRELRERNEAAKETGKEIVRNTPMGPDVPYTKPKAVVAPSSGFLTNPMQEEDNGEITSSVFNVGS